MTGVLLPTLQAAQLKEGLTDYLATTFALTEPDARASLIDFVGDPDTGMFKGPYVRLRLPFAPAAGDWGMTLDWSAALDQPYGHQAAAFERLSTKFQDRPLPTLVTTGTGSGKTESFLTPIIDHVLRMRKRGQAGMKALILYPMNALANDQAGRLTRLLTGHPELSGITAGLLTGEQSSGRTMVSVDGLITDRKIMQQSAPDILLTNYKMLDWLLLRPDFTQMWQDSAESLQYLVLDEFHTYDGAQGTDVAMLLRRLGLTLKSHWTDQSPASPDDHARPLGRITPVATSATLGDGSDPASMLRFAETIFGEQFPADAVIGETRLTADSWLRNRSATLDREFIAKEPVVIDAARRIGEAVAAASSAGHDVTPVIVRAVLAELFDACESGSLFETPDPDSLFETSDLGLETRRALTPNEPGLKAVTSSELVLDLIKGHPLVGRILASAQSAVSLADLAAEVLPSTLGVDQFFEQARLNFLEQIFAMLSKVRETVGRSGVSVEVHLWIRELSRIDRLVRATTGFRWSDDGVVEDSTDMYLPAIYCRHCGRSGWGAKLAPTGTSLDISDENIRGDHMAGNQRFRALISAPGEAAQTEKIDGLRWFHTENRDIRDFAPDPSEREASEGRVLPVLVLTGPDQGEQSRDDRCPACGIDDGIRFMGSAVATQLSVTLSNLFGAKDLDRAEKKALMFTDSVQDAAHRAGFVQARSHTLSLRSALRSALSAGPLDLTDLTRQVVADAGGDPQRRYQLLAPDVVDREEFRPFWDRKAVSPARRAAELKAKRRLQFDIDLEFGLQSRVGRTLELTGSVVAEVYLGVAGRAVTLGRLAVAATEQPQLMASISGTDDPVALGRWVRGTVERVRGQGGILHEWLHRYINDDAKRWAISGGRPRGEGMPAFPSGRPAPTFPALAKRVTTAAPAPKRGVAEGFAAITSPQSWYALWASKSLGVPPQEGAFLAKSLFAVLAEQRILGTRTSEAGVTVYGLQPGAVEVSVPSPEGLEGQRHLLVCDVCHSPVPGTETVIDELDLGNCLQVRCPGRLHRTQQEPNFYRSLYDSAEMKRVVAREHTSLLPTAERLRYEEAFKGSGDDPQAPNVLVATPTLEMGIDIGDLSTVMLGSLPRSVASYLQRVGRAGRLTGNSLVLAFVRGRGEHLPKLFEPLSVIQGQVRPPATFLNAEEILQRQYVAHIADRLARDPQQPVPKDALAALGSLETRSWLGRFISLAEAGADDYLGEFLGQFGDLLTDDAREALRDWAQPPSGGGSSGLTLHLQQTAQRWERDRLILSNRRASVNEQIPDLKVKADSPAATDEDRRALRTAQGSVRMLGGQIRSITTEHWIAVLERYGVFPNYTLLDDTVTLDVGITWIDPDTSEFKGDEISYHRGSRVALTELAPGATFYAQGLAVKIDAVEIEQGESNIETWQVCPQCGWLGIQVPGGVTVKVATCPRCKNAAISDMKQSFNVVEMKKVSAEVKRDEASINDARDERTRRQFTVFSAADINPANVAASWFVENRYFGAEYLKQLDLRWLNLGPTSGQGQKRMIAGMESTAALFRVCAHCGQLDTAAGKNNRDEHRSWCSHRLAPTEDVREIALARSLRTQGVLLHLPSQLEYDPFAHPSLAAAVLLGLREVIGGSPEHLDVATISDALQAPEHRALLIHDTVPGGTGYLAEFAHPERVWSVLERAWSVLRNCPCREEDRLACHRCLLPFAHGHEMDKVSRAVALQLLTDILGVEGRRSMPDFEDWQITDIPPEPLSPDDESFLEKAFFQGLIERLKTVGGTVTLKPSVSGSSATIVMPGEKARRWTLRPQVQLGYVTPDFVLSTQDPSIPQVAIFTDGRKFHASAEHNRVTDDAEKRDKLRDQGFLVWAITHTDLQDFRENTVASPAWLTDAGTKTVLTHFKVQPATLDLLKRDAVSQLFEFILKPDIEGWRLLSLWMPYLFMRAELRRKSDAESAAEGALAALNGSAPFVESGPDVCWSLATESIVLTAAVTSATDKAATAVLAIDDRPTALELNSGAGWREWLRTSNWLGIAGPHRITTRALLEQDTTAAAVVSAETPFEPQWVALLEETVTDVERELVKLLAARGGVPLPQLGYETADGSVLDIAWPDLGLAVCLDPDSVDAQALRSAGWTLLSSDSNEVAAAIAASTSTGEI